MSKSKQAAFRIGEEFMEKKIDPTFVRSLPLAYLPYYKDFIYECYEGDQDNKIWKLNHSTLQKTEQKKEEEDKEMQAEERKEREEEHKEKMAKLENDETLEERMVIIFKFYASLVLALANLIEYTLIQPAKQKGQCIYIICAIIIPIISIWYQGKPSMKNLNKKKENISQESQKPV